MAAARRPSPAAPGGDALGGQLGFLPPPIGDTICCSGGPQKTKEEAGVAKRSGFSARYKRGPFSFAAGPPPTVFPAEGGTHAGELSSKAFRIFF